MMCGWRCGGWWRRSRIVEDVWVEDVGGMWVEGVGGCGGRGRMEDVGRDVGGGCGVCGEYVGEDVEVVGGGCGERGGGCRGCGRIGGCTMREAAPDPQEGHKG